MTNIPPMHRSETVRTEPRNVPQMRVPTMTRRDALQCAITGDGTDASALDSLYDWLERRVQ